MELNAVYFIFKFMRFIRPIFAFWCSTLEYPNSVDEIICNIKYQYYSNLEFFFIQGWTNVKNSKKLTKFIWCNLGNQNLIVIWNDYSYCSLCLVNLNRITLGLFSLFSNLISDSPLCFPLCEELFNDTVISTILIHNRHAVDSYEVFIHNRKL